MGSYPIPVNKICSLLNWLFWSTLSLTLLLSCSINLMLSYQNLLGWLRKLLIWFISSKTLTHCTFVHKYCVIEKMSKYIKYKYIKLIISVTGCGLRLTIISIKLVKVQLKCPSIPASANFISLSVGPWKTSL